MRIYEYAKKIGLSHKDALKALHDRGIEVASHMAHLTDDAQKVLDEICKKSTAVDKKFVTQDKTERVDLSKQSEVKIPVEPKKEIITKPFQKPVVAPVTPTELKLVVEPMSVVDFAEKISKPVSDVILVLLRQKVIAVKNQILPEKIIYQLARHYDIPVIEREKTAPSSIVREDIVEGLKVIERLPVVVVIGHVDHGKTTLLDFIRNTRVAAKEKGGITQHIGAYEAQTRHGNIVFIDTPGHEAFVKMRERGTRVADIAVLVVAADDGPMPQTVEAIRQAAAAKIPLVVAVNKIDRATQAQIEGVKTALTQYGLVPEEWGGQTIFMPVSAKVGTGVDALLEVLVLQAKMMELKAYLDAPARGYVIEAKFEKGRGAVGTVICHNGVLSVGDCFVAGGKTGRVTALVDSSNKRIQKAYPSQPVQVSGFDTLPQAGDVFEVIPVEQLKKMRQQSHPATTQVSEAMLSQVSGKDNINLVLKTDNDSSREAILSALEKINLKAYRPLRCVHVGVGSLNENDVQLAQDTGSSIYVFNTKPEIGAGVLATKYGLVINQFGVIYHLTKAFEELAEAGRPVKKVLKKVGEAVILKVFTIKGFGVIAGARIKSGRLLRDAKVAIFRQQTKIGEGVVKTLERERRPIKEATTGFECAFSVDGFVDWLPDDVVECYQEVVAQ
jgi:translation initiation factor IF-2